MPEVCWNRIESSVPTSASRRAISSIAAVNSGRENRARSAASSRYFAPSGRYVRYTVNELSNSAMASSASGTSGASRASRTTSVRSAPSAAAQLGVQLVQRRLAPRVDEQPVHCGERFVPAGAGAVPRLGQPLVTLDDLLHHHVPVSYTHLTLPTKRIV